MPENQSPPPLTNTSPVWRRAWHPVAHAEDVAAAPVQVLVAGTAWVVARFDGALAASRSRSLREEDAQHLHNLGAGEHQPGVAALGCSARWACNC